MPLVGLMLNYTPWGITLAPIMVSLAVFAEALALGAFVRKYRYYKLSLIDYLLDRIISENSLAVGLLFVCFVS